ncbi:MAG: ATP-binding protein [Pseudomonadota bacterium]
MNRWPCVILWGMQQQDNLTFINRHHRAMTIETQKPKRDGLLVAVGIVLLILYFCFAIVILRRFDVNDAALVTNIILVIMGGGLLILVHQLFLRFGSRAQEHSLLREVMEGSTAIRFITNIDNHIVYSNQHFDDFCRLIGASPSFASFVSIFESVPESQVHISTIADQAHRGLSDAVQLSLRRNDAWFYYRIMARPVPGRPGTIAWRVDDVTEQRELDRAISEEREKLIDFTDNAPVGFFSVDQEGRFVFVNATFARWLGDDIGTLLTTGRLHNYMFEPPQNAAPFDVIDKGGVRQLAELRMKGPGGRSWQASINQSVVMDSEGRVRTRAVVYDLTSERSMRQALQASEDRFRRFFEEAPVGIAILDADGHVRDGNPELFPLLGKSRHDIEDKLFSQFVAEKDRAAVASSLESLRTRESFEAPLEIQLLPREGTLKQSPTVRLYARRFKNSDNIVLHFIDLTQQKSLEQQFAQSQKMQAVGQLAGGVAHDFNNLLTAIIGFCDLLLLRHKPGDPSFSDIMQIQQNSNRAANLVRQLLAFSRQQTLRPKVQDVTDVLIEVSHLLRRLIGANIALNLVHGEGLGLVRVDALQLEQVLINLAVNGRDAMPEGGTLTISTAMQATDASWRRGGDEMPPGNWVVISVSDTGHGIPADILPRILEPFFTTKDVGQGTGLGLSTVYGIIRQTGGYLHCHSGVGEGTTFSIYLPVDAGEVEVEAVTAASASDNPVADLTGAAQILLVEDEDAVRAFSTRALTNKGYDVLAAESGEAALALMAEKDNPKIDMLITDVIMPNMDGPTLAKKLRETIPTLKILFMSGYTEERLKEHMDERVFFLPKPFTLKILAQKVKDVLEA